MMGMLPYEHSIEEWKEELYASCMDHPIRERITRIAALLLLLFEFIDLFVIQPIQKAQQKKEGLNILHHMLTHLNNMDPQTRLLFSMDETEIKRLECCIQHGIVDNDYIDSLLKNLEANGQPYS
jgi:cell division FtsZ-interacting protein ZapD